MQRVIFAVGLTGGHIYPAVALAEDLGKNDFEYLFVVRAKSRLALQILEKSDFPSLCLDVMGLPRGLGIFRDGLRFAWRQFRAFCLCWKALKDWKPDLAVGFGAYVSFPVIFAAKLQGIPALIYEPNAAMGLANKVLAPWVDKIAYTMPVFAATNDLSLRLISLWLKRLTTNVAVVEPPLRRSLKDAAVMTAGEARKIFGLDLALPCLLIFGGSQGAQVVNHHICRGLAVLLAQGKLFTFLHITGEKTSHQIKDFYAGQGVPANRGKCLEYLEEIGWAYRAADLVVSRAGAMTCHELIFFKKQAVLIPLAASAESHQWHNAYYLEHLGIATIIKESELDESRLAGVLSARLGALAVGREGQSALKKFPATLTQVVKAMLEHNL
ncbi:MAG: UDP-N-acetylglucosamine--N-acetylmuramyl-(pentapeptide) pyrophosphoryl-undecaprenol N-acetylglucosamine transferase [Elusimicrobia bacterium]|nr:UDP-N-acetylglucosamine--N-acetylmuramyl-(pentapeptide) pyrophosphoryl-undecaprenol N-acetylglucosamine transferase [Elusimicrobiota bacterium]